MGCQGFGPELPHYCLTTAICDGLEWEEVWVICPFSMDAAKLSLLGFQLSLMRCLLGKALGFPSCYDLLTLCFRE